MNKSSACVIGVVAASLIGCGTESGAVNEVIPTTSILTFQAPPLVVVDGPATDVALALVWGAVFGQDSPPPAVVWVGPNCEDGRGYLLDSGDCVEGQVLGPVGAVRMAMREGAGLTSVPFSHELCHAALWVETGDPDAGHVDVCFREGGRAIASNAVLRAARL